MKQIKGNEKLCFITKDQSSEVAVIILGQISLDLFQVCMLDRFLGWLQVWFCLVWRRGASLLLGPHPPRHPLQHHSVCPHHHSQATPWSCIPTDYSGHSYGRHSSRALSGTHGLNYITAQVGEKMASLDDFPLHVLASDRVHFNHRICLVSQFFDYEIENRENKKQERFFSKCGNFIEKVATINFSWSSTVLFMSFFWSSKNEVFKKTSQSISLRSLTFFQLSLSYGFWRADILSSFCTKWIY